MSHNVPQEHTHQLTHPQPRVGCLDLPARHHTPPSPPIPLVAGDAALLLLTYQISISRRSDHRFSFIESQGILGLNVCSLMMHEGPWMVRYGKVPLYAYMERLNWFWLGNTLFQHSGRVSRHTIYNTKRERLACQRQSHAQGRPVHPSFQGNRAHRPDRATYVLLA